MTIHCIISRFITFDEKHEGNISNVNKKRRFKQKTSYLNLSRKKRGGEGGRGPSPWIMKKQCKKNGKRRIA